MNRYTVAGCFFLYSAACSGCNADGSGGLTAGALDGGGAKDLLAAPTSSSDLASAPAPDLQRSMELGSSSALYPDAPDPAHFMWPSLQERFHRQDGSECLGRVTVAAAGTAVCYVGADDELYCAGKIYTHDYGPAFTAVGETGVDQILLLGGGSAICVHETSGVVKCMGDGNSNGAFADGNRMPSAVFVPWSTMTDIPRLGPPGDPLCVLDHLGEVSCAGYMLGVTPRNLASGGGHTSFWGDTNHALQVDDPTVFREANGSPCQVMADGLHCLFEGAQMLVGTAGKVVDGTVASSPDFMLAALVCWLETTGQVHCAVSGLKADRFTAAAPVLAIAGNANDDSMCAVGSDGSLWCIGSNDSGQFGNGSTSPLADETEVAPAGSVRIDCQ